MESIALTHNADLKEKLSAFHQPISFADSEGTMTNFPTFQNQQWHKRVEKFLQGYGKKKCIIKISECYVIQYTKQGSSSVSKKGAVIQWLEERLF